MKNNITTNSRAIIISAFFIASTSFVLAWTGPTSVPPNGNTPAPVNVALNTQSKLGQLFVNTDLSNPYTVGLSVFGQSVFNGKVKIVDGSEGVGKVLTSDANGLATWQALAGSIGSSTTGTGYAFGGIYMVNEENDAPTFTFNLCRYPNAITGSCSCPSGYTSARFWDWVVPNQGYYKNPGTGVAHLYMCYAKGGGSSGTTSTTNAFTHMQVYNTPGTYTWSVPVGVTSAMIEVWGAGGAAYYRESVGNHGTQIISGTSGTEGGYAKGVYSVDQSSYTVTVGKGGVLATDESTWSNDNTYHGTEGTQSSFGSLIYATGGGRVVTGPSRGVNGIGHGQINVTGIRAGYSGDVSCVAANPGEEGYDTTHPNPTYSRTCDGGSGQVVIYY
jgi:hypothetical protein